MNTEPRSGSTSAAAIFSRVDLPVPLRPTRDTRSPELTDSSAPERSGVPPKVRTISLSCRRGEPLLVVPAGRAIECRVRSVCDRLFDQFHRVLILLATNRPSDSDRL